LALKILLAPDQNGVEAIALLKEAALKPKIFAELWTQFQEDLPNDRAIRYYLRTEKNFNPDAVNYVIKPPSLIQWP
jgi:hypothetical protein